MVVYTFWEPRENMPYYVQLCMETWKKNLPNTEIVLLDYKNIGEYINIDEFDKNLFSGRFRLALIADAIRVALLAKHGGVWMDADTIILNSDVEKYFLTDKKQRTVFFGNHIAFINAPPASELMNSWFEFVKEKLRTLTPETEIGTFFFGNSFLASCEQEYADKILKLKRGFIMPELKLRANDELLTIRNRRSYYFRYYFLQNLHLTDINVKMILLHNSWTPKIFKDFSPEEFLRCDCTLTNVLAEALDIKLPPAAERFRLFRKENKEWIKVPDTPPPPKKFRLVTREDDA